jgi:putative spermidine/putrescine transport system substrate-binding protein
MDSRFRGNDGSPVEDIRPDVAELAVHPIALVVEMDCLVVPKGAPHKDLAMKVIGAIVSPDIQANLPKYINYAPINQKAYDPGRIPADVAAKLNTSPEDIRQQIVLNVKWWAEHAQEVQERFDKLMH